MSTEGSGDHGEFGNFISGLVDHIWQPFDETIGEIDGRNRARGARADAATDAKDAAYQKTIAQNQENLQKFREDVQASRAAQSISGSAAGSLKSTTQAVYNPISPDGVSKLGSDETSFLGV